jgi:hypothetical protein
LGVYPTIVRQYQLRFAYFVISKTIGQ